MDSLLNRLREFDALRDVGEGGDRVLHETKDAIPPTYADTAIFSRLAPTLEGALKARGIHRLYQHQADAIEAGLQGLNVVLQAPTASGKSLAFQVPMLNTLVGDEKGRALMIYPTKALSLDQREQLMLLTDEMPSRSIQSWWYDGDTSQEERTLIRQNPLSPCFGMGVGFV